MPDASSPLSPSATGTTLPLREADAKLRPRLQHFIARRFNEAYGARLYSFMPRLFGLYGRNGELHAAFGLRAAQAEPLFLERYLDSSVETLIGCGSREGIVEVGNLAGATPGALRELIPLLCDLLVAEGFHWVAFTGSARLCNSFSRLGLPLQVMASAPVTCLSVEERRRWGRYYEHSPSVMVGDLLVGRQHLHRPGSDAEQLLATLARVGAP